MALCRLTLNWNGNPTVYVNPRNVVSIWSQSNGTSITTTATGKEGPSSIYVTEDVETVRTMLDNAERT